MNPGSPAHELVERSARNAEIATSSSGARGLVRVGTWPALMLIALLVAACSGPPGGTGPAPTEDTNDVETPQPATFDVAAVKASFTEECRDPIVVDEFFCQQVDIAGMTADGEILNVPTGLSPAARDRASAICDQFTVAHFDEEGNDLGYEIIGILDMNGGNAAACSVDR